MPRSETCWRFSRLQPLRVSGASLAGVPARLPVATSRRPCSGGGVCRATAVPTGGGCVPDGTRVTDGIRVAAGDAFFERAKPVVAGQPVNFRGDCVVGPERRGVAAGLASDHGDQFLVRALKLVARIASGPGPGFWCAVRAGTRRARGPGPGSGRHVR